MSARYLIGDVFDTLATLEPGSVDLVMTSPPFLALRSYLSADHPDKAKELGSEATPGGFIDTMLDVVEACARVLAPHGSLVFELGDTYCGARGYGSEDGNAGVYGERSAERWREARVERTFKRKNDGWPRAKSKVLIPQLFAVALSYGFNPLTGRQTPQWRVRNTVAWCRPNPPVGRDADKFRPATSFLTVACKARDRYWDGDAVRTPGNSYDRPTGGPNGTKGFDRDDVRKWDERLETHPAAAPLLDWWEIPTAPYKGAHYATYPPDLVVPIVKAMCPQRACRVCGQPSRRITVTTNAVGHAVQRTAHRESPNGAGDGRVGVADINHDAPDNAVRETLGWTDCGHDAWRPGHVLDPFAGTGVTGLVATGHGLDCTLIDLDERNADLALERVGPMLLTVERPNPNVSTRIEGTT